MKKSVFFFIVALLVLLLCGCPHQTIQTELENQNQQTVSKGVLKGKAFYSNSADSSTIKIVLDKTDGLLTDPVLDALQSGRSVSNSKDSSRTVVAYQNCNSDGSFQFSNLEEGLYTVYAFSADSTEKAVYRSITVTYDDVSEIPELVLTATGSLSGKITLDNSTDNNAGFIVFVAGTSYMVATASDGSFTISGLPAGTDYQIIIMKGSYIHLWKTAIQAVAFRDTDVGEINFESKALTISPKDGKDGKNGTNGINGTNGTNGTNGKDGKDGTPIVWKGSFESDSVNELKEPQYLWTYYNTTDGCSYIYDGENWTLLASAGKNGSVVSGIKDPINYVLDGGKLPQEAPLYHTLGTITTLVEPVKDKALFIGFYLDENFSGEPITELNNDYILGQKLYAKWIGEWEQELLLMIKSGESGTCHLSGDISLKELRSILLSLYASHPNLEVVLDFSEMTSIIDVIPNFTGCNNIVEVIVPDILLSRYSSLFANCQSINSVILCEDIESIGNNAFEYCSYLKNITIPGSVTYIGDRAFSCCNNLTNITIPSSVNTIGEYAFNQCSNLKNINISENTGLTSINNGTFSNCNSITNIILPSSLTKIGDNAFCGCENLLNLSIPSNVTCIGTDAFYNCENLLTITIPSSIISIGENAFGYCRQLYEIYNLSNLNLVIGSYDYGFIATNARIIHTALMEPSIFYTTKDGSLFIKENDYYYLMRYNSNEANIILPDRFELEGNTSIIAEYGIYNSAFYYRRELENITIPDTITSIGERAFAECFNLQKIKISNNSRLKSIGSMAFSNCSQLAEINIPSCVISIGDYAFGSCRRLKNITIPEGITCIEYGTFDGCDTLESVLIPDSVETIGPNAFLGCNSLTNINIPDGVTVIGSQAFANCHNLRTLIIPDGITIISDRAFYFCSSVTKIIIPDGVTTIEESAFSLCGNLTDIIIPASVTDIWEDAFQGCNKLYEIYNLSTLNFVTGSTDYGSIALNAKVIHSSLDEPSIFYTTDDGFVFYNDSNYFYLMKYDNVDSEIILPESVEIGNKTITEYGIYDNAFSGAEYLKKITIPDSVKSIGDEAFIACDNLTSVSIPDDSCLIRIGESAFSDCRYLTSITIPDSVTSIGDKAFYNCNSLGDVTIPNGLETIGNGVFFGCNNLKNLTIPNSITSIGEEAFCGCDKIVELVIPDSVTSIGRAAFRNCGGLKKLKISNNLTSLNESVFFSCGALTFVTIPSNVVRIGASAFFGCRNLLSVIIPESVSYIDNDAFFACSRLYEIYNLSDLNFVIGSHDYGDIACNAKVIYTSLAEHSIFYKTKDDSLFIKQNNSYYLIQYNSSENDIVLPDSFDLVDDTTTISSYGIYDGTFNGYTNIRSITISSSVTSIGNNAFANCGLLSDVIIPENSSLLTIGDAAFSNCIGLKNITFPKSLLSIGDRVFYMTWGLKNITIPNSVTHIGKSPFFYLNSLTISGVWMVDDTENIINFADYTDSECFSLFSNTYASNSWTRIE